MPLYPLLTVATLLLLELANHIYIKYYAYFPILRSFSFIGIAIHEYLHAFACIITGAKIHEIKIHPTHGHVQHGPSWIGTPGNILISMAPLIGGIALLYLLTAFILNLSPLELHASISSIAASNSLQEILFNIEFLIGLLIKSLSTLGFKIPIILFLLLNLAATITPSARDYLNNIFGLTGIVLTSTLLYLIPVEAVRNLLDFICIQIIIILSFALLMYLVLILLLAIFVIISKFIYPKHVQIHSRKRRK